MNTEQVDTPDEEIDNRPRWKKILKWETKSKTADQLLLLAGGVVMFLVLIPWFLAARDSGNWCPVISHAISIIGFGITVADKNLMDGKLYNAGLFFIALGIGVSALTAYK